MRVLVTGATGFVGSHLVTALASRGHQVVAVTRRDVECPGAHEVRVAGDIGPSTDWSGLLGDVDVVVHLAARVHMMNETSADPLAAFREVSAAGTVHVAEEVARQGVRRLVFMSSIKVHGGGRDGKPYSSLDAPAPADPYGVSKWEAEQALGKIARETGMECVALRPTVIYGPGVRANVDRLAHLVASGIPLPFGRVHNRRTMLSVGNLVKWVDRAVSDSAKPTGPVLIGDPRPVSTKELTVQIASGLGVRARMIPVPVGIMMLAGRVVGKQAMLQRLLGDLEVTPTVEAYPGIESQLVDPAAELESYGASLREPEAH